jgi:3'(2'), 5'-bisphosphate nucleotidase
MSPTLSASNPRLAHEFWVARDLARRAGVAAMRFYGSTSALEKSDASPVTEADHAANALIVGSLASLFPADAILSEESRDSERRFRTPRVWIVDPLDGTREFLAQNGEFAVMIGLVEAGEPVLGVVHLPARGVTYGAVRGRGAWVGHPGAWTRLVRGPAVPDGLRLVGSRSHADPLTDRIREVLAIPDLQVCGSVGLKCALVAEGARDLYIHPVPYLKEWDTCAPEVILTEAGGWVSDCRGEPLRYNKADPVQPYGILASAAGCAAAVLARVKPVLETATIGARS